MNIREIPVRVVGPGSQSTAADATLAYIDMPSDMATYAAPVMPDPNAVAGLAGARETMAWLREALAEYTAGKDPLLADLSALDADCRELVNQVLGEG